MGGNRPSNIVQLLGRRQIEGWSCGISRQLVSCLPTSQISLSQILDRERRLLHGHVILGFNRSGDHVISYHLCINGSSHAYSLHWWRFDLHRPLSHVCSFQLFQGELIHLDLHLLVCQSPDEKDTIVIGCRKVLNQDDCRTCYVSILPSPTPDPSSSHSLSLHFKFDLLSPFPAFIPSLSLKIPGCVIVNTGDSLVALRYRLCTEVDSRGVGEWVGGKHSFHSQHLFASAGQPPTTASPQVCSPSHLLPVEAYSGDRPLTEVRTYQSASLTCATVRQSRLDVELWLSEALLEGVEEEGFTFHSLTDYDLQLVEVCSAGWEVVYMVAVLLEASACSPPSHGCYSVEITASWNILTGCARVLRFANMHPSSLTASLYCGSVGTWNPAAQLCLTLRRQWHQPVSLQHTVRAFSNHTVFTGKSLHSLPHPYLPLSVVMRQSNTT